ncbi:XdhC family protein [Paenirhodobacter populi]|uniref:XdhC family protein n=1 Tax=Paenirhodobacter populi TaxID=2306993 RepID=A0A443IRY3_9RHOB|nr:XdhC family protein [Sinirhodobacter populi]RWR09585.1 XdhC family protein [Sinirhodobacter populi]
MATASHSIPETRKPRPDAPVVIRAADLPLNAVEKPVALAVIREVAGPSYRPAGAAMVLGADGTAAGNLSSGCIDADIALHAQEVAATGGWKVLRYGRGSAFMDLQLPCGGGLEVLIVPVRRPLGKLLEALEARTPLDLRLTPEGPVSNASADLECLMHLHVEPDIRFAVFGKGPEARAFAQMTVGAGYDTLLVTAEDEMPAPMARLQLRPLRPGAVTFDQDPNTAVVLFFHDHDLEPGILRAALAGPAFYIGAQGSRRTAERRIAGLRATGMTEADCLRLRGPIGLIPSTRDPRTLAVSVLAEVLAEAVGRSGTCGL